MENDFFVWDEVTDRKAKMVNQYLSYIDKNLRSITRLNQRETCNFSLLSLGEGCSDFILKNLNSSPSNSDFYAIDALTQSKYWKKGSSRYQDFKSKWPHNYVTGLFQTMNYKIDSRELYFDEIIASYSLYFLISMADLSECIETLGNILSHLKPGGVLRVFPFANIEEDKITNIYEGVLFKGFAPKIEYKIDYGQKGFFALQV